MPYDNESIAYALAAGLVVFPDSYAQERDIERRRRAARIERQRRRSR
jgi:hypothetical protein